ncbi:MAG TPA: hypothetical protein VIL71_04510 [Spirillospora sp.]
MAALDPLGRTARAWGGRRTTRGLAALTLALGVTAALPPGSGSASALPQAPEDIRKKYAKLKAESEKLSKEYRGELVTLEEAKRAAERAGVDAARAKREYDAARADVARLASTSYMTGRIDVVPIITAAEPGTAVHDAAVIEHLSRNNGRRLRNLEALTAKARQSDEAARKKLEAVEKEIKDLKSQRARVRKLLAKYEPQAAQAPVGRPDGASGTKSPIVGNSMTARMRSVLVEIDGKFGPFPTIGCARPGDPQDHGSGTACDFMESTGGRMPSASAQAHGDGVAQYLINNASRLGLKYIIWKQRIYDFRSSGGWRQMEDRGSITQNHYDHIHVSVL